MTVIVWDGHTLAADRQSTHDGVAVRSRKIFRVRTERHGLALVGCAGDTGECREYFRWVSGQRKDKPTFSNIRIMHVLPSHQIWVCDEKIYWYRITRKNWAIGSGGTYALGAMAAGKTAVEAVRIACKLDVNCGLGVDTQRF